MAGPRSIVLGRQKPPGVAWPSPRTGDLLSASAEGVRQALAAVSRGRRGRAGAVVAARRRARIEPGRGSRGALRRRATTVSTARSSSCPSTGRRPSIYELRGRPGARVYGIVRRAWIPADGSSPCRVLQLGTSRAELRSGSSTSPPATSAPSTPTPRARTAARSRKRAGGLAVPLWLPDGRLVSDGDAGLRRLGPRHRHEPPAATVQEELGDRVPRCSPRPTPGRSCASTRRADRIDLVALGVRPRLGRDPGDHVPRQPADVASPSTRPARSS